MRVCGGKQQLRVIDVHALIQLAVYIYHELRISRIPAYAVSGNRDKQRLISRFVGCFGAKAEPCVGIDAGSPRPVYVIGHKGIGRGELIVLFVLARQDPDIGDFTD